MNALPTSTPSTRMPNITTAPLTDARTATSSPSPSSSCSSSSESDLTPLLTAWDQAHPAVTFVDVDWRHLLDEIAHPDTTQAFHRLAEAAA